MLSNELKDLSGLSKGQTVYVAPAGGAARRFVEVLAKHRPDIEVIGFLDSYRSFVLCGRVVEQIDQIKEPRPEVTVIIVMEREDIRKQISATLDDAGFSEVCWISSRFNVDQEVGEDKGNNVLYFFYDLSVNALNYEFIVALCHAEVERKILGFSKLHPVIVPKRLDSIYDLSRTSITQTGGGLEADNYWFLHNVIVPATALLPSCESITLCGSRQEAKMLTERLSYNKFPHEYDIDFPLELNSNRNLLNKEIYDGNGYGQPLVSRSSSLSFVKQWLRKNSIDNKKNIVITLRQNCLQKGRNSDLDAWRCFAQQIEKKGYVPIFIKDTYSDFESDDLGNFLIFHEASWNILLRMAMYEMAYLNMTVNTGTYALCAFNSKTRYLAFIYLCETDPVGSTAFHEAAGTPVGSQYPASTPFQRWVWGGSNCCDCLMKEFQSMCKLLESDHHVVS